MEEAIMSLHLAVRDAERGMAAHWAEVEELRAEVAQTQMYLDKAYKRHAEAAGWLEGLQTGLAVLEKLNAEVIN